MNDTTDLRQAATLLANSRFAIAFTGAGLSTPSGIPDFRSPGSGVWARLEEAGGVEAVQELSVQAFGRNPEAFYQRLRPLLQLILAARPNAAHLALAKLEVRGTIQAVITQNVDRLHQQAGSQQVIELHGSLDKATCLSCYSVVPFRSRLEKFLAEGEAPRCTQCGGWMKPNIILTGEQLPARAVLSARQALGAADVVLVAASSLSGGPATALVENACLQGVPIIIINKTPTLMDAFAAIAIHEDVAVALPAINQFCS